MYKLKIAFLFLIFISFVRPAMSEEITLKSIGGIHKIPVTLNGLLTLDFIVDTGASDVILSDDITDKLIRTGAIDKKDIRGFSTYEQADGSSFKCRNLIIRSVRVGSRTVENVKAGSCPQKASLLLGQSFWNKLGGTLSFKKKGELVVAFVSGEPIEAPTAQAETPAAQTETTPAQAEIPIPKATIPATQSGCNFEMDKIINAPSTQAINSSWFCYVKQGSQTLPTEIQIFGDGTGFNGDSMFSWKRTECNSISYLTNEGTKGSMEDFSGDVKYGIATFTLRVLAAPPAPAVCTLLDVKIAARKSHNLLHDTGHRASEEFSEAAEAHRKTAEQGDATAQYSLGAMYESGGGVPKDLKKAFEWYQKAAMQGHAMAQFNLGMMYAKGEGVRKNSSKAAEWYQKAATQGHAWAQINLGWMYYNGKGVRKDLAMAAEWWQQAAAQGNAQAKSDLQNYMGR